MKKIKLSLVLLLITSFLISCRAKPVEGDDQAPLIEVISPNDHTIIYTTSSNSSPNSIRIHAKATDNNVVVFGILTVTDGSGDLVDADFESNFSDDDAVLDISTEFSTNTIGSYTFTFLFRDANNNNASVTRTVECIEGSNEEKENAITMQLYASDREHENVIRVDFYNDNTVKETELAKDFNDAQAIATYIDDNEVLFGSTQSGLDVEVASVGTNGENLLSHSVSIANYLFGALAKDQTEQTIYYFLEGANLTKVNNHRLYRMQADGTNQTLLAQVDNATRKNAIEKMLIYRNTGHSYLVMHDRNSVYLIDPDNIKSISSSVIFSTENYQIHDIAMGANNKIVYMVLSHYEGSDIYYNVATTNFDGEANLNLVEIAQNHPVTSQFYPHRMKLDIENQHVYWFTESDDLQKSILKRAGFNDSTVQTVWDTNTCLCVGEVEDIRFEDYVIHIPK